MGILSFLKKDKPSEAPAAAPVAATAIPKDLDVVLKEFISATELPTLSYSAERGETTVYSSKLGGVPYLPKGFEYPHNQTPESDNRPLKLLAQLNFEELPKLEGFPDKGILQFYVAYEPKDDIYGLDFDNPRSQNGFRVIYHEDVVSDESQLSEPPVLDDSSETYFPFEGEFKLKAEVVKQPMSSADFRFENTFMPMYNSHYNENVQHLWDLSDEINDEVWGALPASGHRTGGYPFFTQYDPRPQYPPLNEYTVLLLQIDSSGSGDDEIIWGDCGVANFFITPKQLEERDFTKVLYNWDCY